MLEVKIVTDVESSAEPVTLAEAKAFMVVDSTYTADDTLITSLIKTARGLLEKYTELSFAPKVLKCFTDKSYLNIPYGPINEVTSVVDQDDTEITDDNYTLRGLDFKKIYMGCTNSQAFYPMGGGEPRFDISVPGISYTITYDAGYGVEGGAVLPDALEQAIKEQVNYMYNNRGLNEPVKICGVAERLCAPYSRRTLL